MLNHAMMYIYSYCTNMPISIPKQAELETDEEMWLNVKGVPYQKEIGEGTCVCEIEDANLLIKIYHNVSSMHFVKSFKK